MPIFLDDQPIAFPGRALSEVLSSANDHLADRGRVVVEIQVDGDRLTGDELQAHGNSVVEDTELRLYSANPRDLARSIIAALLTELDQAADLQAQAADLLQRDESNEAMTPLGKMLGIWQQTQQGVAGSVGLVGLDWNELEIAGQPASELMAALIQQLTTVRDAIEAGDFVTLADCLVHEWPDIADRWHEMLTRIIDLIDEVG